MELKGVRLKSNHHQIFTPQTDASCLIKVSVQYWLTDIVVRKNLLGEGQSTGGTQMLSASYEGNKQQMSASPYNVKMDKSKTPKQQIKCESLI